MSKIEKALEKFEKESKKESRKDVKQILPADGEVDNSSLRSVAKDDTGIVLPPVQEANIDEHKTEDVIPSIKIDTFNVEEHIVSYYDSIKKQMWKGPVMVHFRKLLISLTSKQMNKMCKVILFTSAAQKEGKSTISLNTAITLCGDNKSKVVIVDCDFRNPAINDFLGFSTNVGLSDYLAGKAKMKDISFKGLVPGLTIIPAGEKPPNTYELFASERKKQFVSYLRERFDYVIIDTPPVLSFPDTSILAPLSDGVVFVVNGEKSKKSIVKRAVETLRDCDCKIMGFVMNRSEIISSNYGDSSSYGDYDYARS
jgi:capsular exopolysaccharide synthesis family protein